MITSIRLYNDQILKDKKIIRYMLNKSDMLSNDEFIELVFQKYQNVSKSIEFIEFLKSITAGLEEISY